MVDLKNLDFSYEVLKKIISEYNSNFWLLTSNSKIHEFDEENENILLMKIGNVQNYGTHTNKKPRKFQEYFYKEI